MLRGVLEAQAPPKQNATDTINTLSSRLANATLLEDRRGAILGLRSFAKQYPASVASGALRGLISALTRDLEDVDTEKVVLETLLMLFNPNKNSPEADDDIALWLADEFSQRQDNITILLDLLETHDFYCRLYALQLLTAISTARPERTQECILSAPLGTTRLVATLDDSREAVRTAGLLLLNDVTQANPELQKLVAFENAFERIFSLIKSEGSLARGGIVVQDCLSLLANLLDLNAANQSLFRETGHVARLARLLQEDTQLVQQHGEDFNQDPNRDKNLWGFLVLLRLFLVRGNKGTQENQTMFEKHGLLQLVLNLAFEASAGPPIRAEALNTCSDIIRGNRALQERFAHNKVTTPADLNNESDGQGKAQKVYIIDALLNMALGAPSLALFDIRLAASECIQAYFYNHTPIRHHFLRRAIEGHTSGDDETSNILSILINGPRSYPSTDPYRLWFAARIALELLYEDDEAKKMTMAIAEGEADAGEEVVTCIQALTSNLVACLQGGDDDRICVGYLMLLCGWLYDDADAINDLLTEGSVVQSIIHATTRIGPGLEIVQGLSTVLLGILYEFSTKDSPVPRRTLQPLLVSGLGRETYIAKLTRLRQHPLVRDYEVLSQNLSSAPPGGLPEVYFEQTFINFLKDNFSRLVRAIDRDPGKEITRMQDGIDRDLVDSLRADIEDKLRAVQKAESEALTLERRLGQEEADHRRSQETSKAEVARIKTVNEALQKGHAAEVAKTALDHRITLQNTQHQYRRQMDDLERHAKQTTAEAAKRVEVISGQHRVELMSLQEKIRSLEAAAVHARETTEKLQRGNGEMLETLRQRDVQLERLNKDLQQRDAQLKSVKGDLQQRDAEVTRMQEESHQADAQAVKMNEDVQQRDAQISKLKHEAQQRGVQMDALTAEKRHLEKDLDAQRADSSKLEQRFVERDARFKKLEEAERSIRLELKAKEEARLATQTELDDLLIVLQDVEEKRSRDKKKLKELGAEVSDVDEDDVEGDDVEESEVADDGVD